MRVELLTLPMELLAEIASYLRALDLKAFRYSHSRLAHAGFDALLLFMRSRQHLMQRPVIGATEDFLHLSRLPKFRDTIKELEMGSVTGHLSFEKVISRIHLLQLVQLVFEPSVMSADNLMALLSNQAPTLRLLRLLGVKLFATIPEVEEGRTSGWSRVMVLLATKLHLNLFRTFGLEYSFGSDKLIEVVTYPDKRRGELRARGCTIDDIYENDAFIDLDTAEGKTTEAVVRVARAYIDDNGKERFRTEDDRRLKDTYPPGIFPY